MKDIEFHELLLALDPELKEGWVINGLDMVLLSESIW